MAVGLGVFVHYVLRGRRPENVVGAVQYAARQRRQVMGFVVVYLLIFVPNLVVALTAVNPHDDVTTWCASCFPVLDIVSETAETLVSYSVFGILVGILTAVVRHVVVGVVGSFRAH